LTTTGTQKGQTEVQGRGEPGTGLPLRIPVSVVVPAYNEEAAIGPQIDHLQEVMRESGWPYELIVVDDGSTDQTAAVAQAHGVGVIRIPRNRGYGAALKSGIAAARHDWILIIDADGTYPAEVIPKMLEQIQDHDMVVAARIGEEVHIPMVRRPARWMLGRLATYLAEQPIPDFNSGLRVFRKSLAQRFEHLLPAGFSFTTTITMSALCNDYRVLYLPINYARRVGRSKIRPAHAYQFLLVILRTAVYFNPLRVFLPLGGIFFLAGLSKIIFDIFRWKISASAVMCSLTAVILWSVGLLADQIARIAVAPKTK
jgi:glycosyltransferase involved in cell wall biosynthesis